MRHRIRFLLVALLLASTAAGQQPQPAPLESNPSGDVYAHPDDPLLGIPPLPEGKVTLIGGTVKDLDRIRSRVTVAPFASKRKMTVQFDERTRIYRDGVETTMMGIREGDRVYLDTQLDGARVFARNIRVQTGVTTADASGQLLRYDPRRRMLHLRSRLSDRPVRLQLADDTDIRREGGAGGTVADLIPGSLIEVKFSPDPSRKGVAREITITAARGSSFLFVGRVTHIDLRYGLLALRSQTDDKTYDIYFQPARLSYTPDLAVGSEVKVKAEFTGERYTAQSISVLRPPEQK